MKILLCLFGLLIAGNTFASTYHGNKIITEIHSGDSRGCFFFRLEGVSEADPAFPNVRWFAVSFDSVQSKHIFSILLTAQATNRPVNVHTSGGSVCGHPETANVRLFPKT